MAVYEIYPDAGTGNTTVDGLTLRTGVDESWATIIAGAGTHGLDTGTSRQIGVNSTPTTDQWASNARLIYTFDTSEIVGSETIVSATESHYGTGSAEPGSYGQSVVLVESAPASDNAIVPGDYDTTGRGSQQEERASGRITFTAWNTSGYNVFTLNAAGLAGIDKTGITRNGLMGSGDFDESAPTWANDLTDYIETSMADTATTSEDPLLTVTTTEAAGNPHYYYAQL